MCSCHRSQGHDGETLKRNVMSRVDICHFHLATFYQLSPCETYARVRV
jgi:hypothetical protein